MQYMITICNDKNMQEKKIFSKNEFEKALNFYKKQLEKNNICSFDIIDEKENISLFDNTKQLKELAKLKEKNKKLQKNYTDFVISETNKRISLENTLLQNKLTIITLISVIEQKNIISDDGDFKKINDYKITKEYTKKIKITFEKIKKYLEEKNKIALLDDFINICNDIMNLDI